MSLVDKHFKDALKELPEKKLSWKVDRSLRKMIRQRAAELDGKLSFAVLFRRMVAVPVALALLLTTVSGYAYYSPAVITGDFLYPIKAELEDRLYPQDGTSEQRVSYHLWLSERRYAEIREILKRKGGDVTALIPVVHAQDLAEDPLDALLLETLQRATQHVEYAFLVTEEIREVERVEKVKEQIRDTIVKQKVIVDEISPVLKAVKLKEKPKPRVRRVRPPRVEATPVIEEALPLAAEPLLEGAKPVVLEAPSDAEAFETEPVELPSKEERVRVPIPPVAEIPTDEEPVEQPIEEDDIEDMQDLLLDRLAFQDELFQDLEVKVVVAVQGKVKKVTAQPKRQVLEDLLEEEVKADKVFTKALAVHLRQEKKLVEEELLELNKVFVAKEETDSEEELEVAEATPEVPAEPVAVVKKELNKKPVVVAVTEPVEEPAEEPVPPVADEPVVIAALEPEEVPVEEDSLALLAEPGEQPEGPEAEDTPAEEPSVAAVSEVVESPIPDTDSAHDDKEDEDEDDENDEEEGDENEATNDTIDILDECQTRVRALCREFGFQGCLDRLLERCEEIVDESMLRELLEQARKRMQYLQEEAERERAIMEEMLEHQERIEELDIKIERIEDGIRDEFQSLYDSGELRERIRAEIRRER